MPLNDDARARIGSNILRARRAAGLTGQELADRLPATRDGKADRSIVSQWETGKKTPSVDRLADIAAALGTTVSALTEGVEAES